MSPQTRNTVFFKCLFKQGTSLFADGLTWPSHLSVSITETCYMQDPTSSWFLELAVVESFRGSLLSNVNSIMAESSLCSNCGDIKVRQVEQWGLFSSHFVHCSRFIWQKVTVSDITVSLSNSMKFWMCMYPFLLAWNMSSLWLTYISIKHWGNILQCICVQE